MYIKERLRNPSFLLGDVVPLSTEKRLAPSLFTLEYDQVCVGLDGDIMVVSLLVLRSNFCHYQVGFGECVISPFFSATHPQNSFCHNLIDANCRLVIQYKIPFFVKLELEADQEKASPK